MKTTSLWMQIITASLLMACSAMSAQAYEDEGQKIAASLLLESRMPAAGTETTLAIRMSPQAGWHGYWLNPGDAGFPQQLQWHLPEGVTVGELQYPAPEQLLASDLMNYIYHGDYTLLAPLVIADDIAAGTPITLAVDIRYLVCSPKLCVPEQQRLQTRFKVGEKGASKKYLETFNTWRQLIPRPAAASADFTVHKDQFVLSLPLPESTTLAEELHFYPEVNGVLSNTASQSFVRNGDRLFMQTVATEGNVSDFYGVLSLNETLAIRVKAVRQPEGDLVFPIQVNLPPEQPGNLLVTSLITVLGAVLGGFLLNLMPCVFPILSLKVLSLANLSDERVARTGAVAYTFGAVLACLLLGAFILMLRELGHQVG